MSAVTTADVVVVACADLFGGDGETLVSPMGTVPALGARLARLTSEPDLLLTDGEAMLIGDTPAVGQRSEVVEGWLPFRKMLDAVVPSGRRHVVMGANQIDRYGNQNISAIGGHAAPDKQLLGVRGAPGNTVNHKTSYWVPRHSRRVFVESVDVVSGVGARAAREAGSAASRFHELHRVVSNLGVFDFAGPDGAMRLVSVHPGIEVEQVREQTGFTVHADEVVTTREPTDEELRLIRDVLDPDGLRGEEVTG